MQTLTPTSIELQRYYDDGEHTRHYTFRLLDPAAMAKPLPGQFFMLHIPGVGAAPFTFTTAPDKNGEFCALVRCIGSVTRALFDCKKQSILGARGPFGTGWPMAQLSQQRILIIAGGCGLAPLVSLIDQLIDQQNYEQLALIYGAATQAKQLLNPERERWQQHFAVFNVVEDNTYNGLTGTPVDALDTVLNDFTQLPTVVLLCGPQMMMTTVATACVNCGVSPESIWLSIERRMHCGVGLCGHCYLEHQYACKDGPTYRWDMLSTLLTKPQNAEQSSGAFHCF